MIERFLVMELYNYGFYFIGPDYNLNILIASNGNTEDRVIAFAILEMILSGSRILSEII